MARLNKRQLKKAHKKRIDRLFKDYNKEFTYELLTNQLQQVSKLITIKSDHLHMVDWIAEEGQPEIFVDEKALKLIIEHSK